jgi:hypothetical protein
MPLELHIENANLSESHYSSPLITGVAQHWAVVAQFYDFAPWTLRTLSMHTYRCRKAAYSAGATSTSEVESYARQESAL